MDRRPSLLTTAFLLLALCGVSFAAGAATQSAAHPKENSEDVYKYLNPFVDALAIIREKYVDIDKTNPKDLVYGALQGMVNTLDPFSQFMPPDDYKEMQTETSGKFGGLGIEIAIKDDRDLSIVKRQLERLGIDIVTWERDSTPECRADVVLIDD